MKKILVLGASGSIGVQTMDVLFHHKDKFELVGVSVGSNILVLKEILNNFKSVQYVCVQKKQDRECLQEEYPHLTFFDGDQGLQQISALNVYDTMVNALVGFIGLVPTLTAIQQDKIVALANKESLVTGGPLIQKELQKHKATLYPIDSEHSAIFQCLQGNTTQAVDKLIVTASGGSFRDYKREDLQNVSVEEALNHPNWNMGGRITIDSATMMNKGFEVIEAHYLFQIPYDKIEVLIHKESIVHSMVQYQDSAIMAQLGSADMRVPIQYALTFPNREFLYQGTPLDFTKLHKLHFQEVDFTRYPLLKVAYEVGKKGGNYGAIMNAADEVAVQLFLAGKISFLSIEKCVIETLKHSKFIDNPTLDELFESDLQARSFVQSLYERGLL